MCLMKIVESRRSCSHIELGRSNNTEKKREKNQKMTNSPQDAVFIYQNQTIRTWPETPESTHKGLISVRNTQHKSNNKDLNRLR